MEYQDIINDSDSVFVLFSKKLSTSKLHELLNKIYEFVAHLKEEDLCENSLKQLTVKKDLKKGGAPCFLLNYNVDDVKLYPRTVKNEIFSSPEKKIKTESAKADFKDKLVQSFLPEKEVKSSLIISGDNDEKAKEKTLEPKSSTETFSNLFSHFIAPQTPQHNNMNQFSPEDKISDSFDTPKFANELPLQVSSSAILEFAPKFRENKQKITKNLLSENLSKGKPWPDFQTTYKSLITNDFDLETLKPGVISVDLLQALEMKSEKDPPPYFKNLLKVGLPNYYHEEVFYGINSKVPNSFNIKAWKEVGVDPFFFEGQIKEINIIHDEEQNKFEETLKPRGREDLSDDAYLRRYVRKPLNIYKNATEETGQVDKTKKDTIEID